MNNIQIIVCMWNGTYGIMYVIKKIFKLISLISNVLISNVISNVI